MGKRRMPSSNFYLIILLTIVLFILLAGLRTQVVLASARPLVRGLEQQLVAIQVRNYKQIETDHYQIKYQNINGETLDLIAETAEKKYWAVSEAFQYKPDGKITLIIYDDPEEMLKVNFLNKDNPPMGVYFGNSLHILDPSHWISDQQNMKIIFESQGPVLHELVHLFTDHLGGGNFPLWFTEGVSLYYEYALDGYEWGKEVIVPKDYTLKKLYHSFNQLDQYQAYTKAFRIVKGYVEENGEKALLEIINSLGRGARLEHYFPISE
ncbi:peptidase MA family metallohydrolase [Alkaliphilus crotonatoxidans]